MQHPLSNFRQPKFSSISCLSNLSIGEQCYSVVLTIQRQDSLQSKTFDSYGLRSLLSYENQLMPYGSLMSLLCMVITLAKSKPLLVPLRTKSKNVHERANNQCNQTSLTNSKDLCAQVVGDLAISSPRVSTLRLRTITVQTHPISTLRVISSC
jgi:hypothetical protein